MTFRELLKELETMSIQALNKEVRIELDGEYLHIQLNRKHIDKDNGQRVDCSEFSFDKPESLRQEEDQLPDIPDFPTLLK